MSDSEVKEERKGDTEKLRLSWCEPKVAAFTLSFGGAAFVTQAVGAYVSSQVTTLEKAFGLTSIQSGFINSANDIGFLITVIFCSHFARRLHIPRFLAFCTFIYGLATVLCSFPHFIYGSTDKIDVNGTLILRRQEMCLPNDNSTIEYCSSTQTLTKQNSNSVAYGIIILGMIVQGMAKSGRTPLMTVYVDDNVGSRKRTAPYLGIVNAITLFGPSTAFAVGGLFSGIYVTLEDTDITRNDPRWIGAWYLGFLLYGGLAFIMCIPLCFFPRKIKRKHEMNEKIIELPKINGHPSGVKSSNNKSLFYVIKDLLVSMAKLWTNVVFAGTICASSLITMTAGGTISFQAKYVEKQFNTSASWANLVLGASIIASTVIGNLAGGFIVGKFKLGMKGCIRFAIVCIAGSGILFGCGAIFGCSQPIINGPNGIRSRTWFADMDAFARRACKSNNCNDI